MRHRALRENEQKLIWLASGRADENPLEIGHQLFRPEVFPFGSVRVTSHNSIQERHELRALGLRIVTEANQAILAALWPERCKALVTVSGYLITSLDANLRPLPPVAEWGWWYQY